MRRDQARRAVYPEGTLHLRSLLEDACLRGAVHDDWWILSAKHGLLDPGGSPIPPYDETLSSATVGEKQDWDQEVYDQLQQEGLLDGEVKFVIHAGQDYYGELVPLLENHQNVTVEIPTEGLRIGKTKAWYKTWLTD